MKRFDFIRFVDIYNHLHAAQIAADKMRSVGAQPLVDCADFIPLCDKIIAFGETCGFRHTVLKARQMKARMEVNPQLFDSSSTAAEMRSLEGDLASDMMDCLFVHVGEGARIFFENANLLGAATLEAFPDCKDDIVSAGNCIAVELGTAAVFHLMRIAEWGLRAFAHDLGLLQVVIDKSKGTMIPMEFSQWEQILNQLPAKIEERIVSIERGPKKQEAQEFYYSSLNEIRSFKDAWRNHVMHVRQTYNQEDAAAIMSHVGRFMGGLVKYGITSRQKL